jgi:antitoxin PrlF
MFATLTSKGQLRLPREIRVRLDLDAGAILDFQTQADHTITARQGTSGPMPGASVVC